MKLVGYFHGSDPAACVCIDGEIVAYVEEERLIRFKHAPGMFPVRAIDWCLKRAGLGIRDIDGFVCGWDLDRYSNGDIERFYERVNGTYPPDTGTRAWQRRMASWFDEASVRQRLQAQLVPFFGITPDEVPPHLFYPHHKSHAAAAFFLSPCEEALVLTIDGSGDSECTTLWHGKGTELELLHRIEIPHSLGWFYAAVTEFLGFDAYDGEYKVMGLAAYGRENHDIRRRLEQVVHAGPNGFDYVVEPRYIHHGSHSYSGRFTDELVDLIGMPPRQGTAPLERVHEDIAFETQRCLEQQVLRLLTHFRETTGLRHLCIGGGVGLNVKMNSRIHRSDLFDHIFPFPLPNDSGTGLGAAIGLEVARSGVRPKPLDHLYLGPGYSDDEIETQIRSCGMRYHRSADIAAETADLLAQGKVVGWFQGRLEAGPRALGGRSILADPRRLECRDRVNGAIKFREYWRPFCPSMTEESAERFLKKSGKAPYMILAFDATDEAKAEVPGVVHIDGTLRAQTVDADSNPCYHRMLCRFEEQTGVPVVLNTSFNIKGEAIVCSPRDAFRTFWSTGIDALAIGSFLIEKPDAPVATPPEDVIR